MGAMGGGATKAQCRSNFRSANIPPRLNNSKLLLQYCYCYCYWKLHLLKLSFLGTLLLIYSMKQQARLPYLFQNTNWIAVAN